MIFTEVEKSYASLNWAQFYLTVGRIYGRDIIDDSSIHNTVLKIHYPNYLPHFIALGIADQIYEKTIDSAQNYDIRKKLKEGMLVFYKVKADGPERPHTFVGFSNEGYPIVMTKGKNPTRTTVGRDWNQRIRIANIAASYKNNRALKSEAFHQLKRYYPECSLELISRNKDVLILLIGNETMMKTEAEQCIEDIPFYKWLLLKPFQHQQSFYLTNIYSSRYKGELPKFPEKTVVIYASLDAFYYFYEELRNFSSIILYSQLEKSPNEAEGLSMIYEALEQYEASDIIEKKLINLLPKGIEMGTWKVDFT